VGGKMEPKKKKKIEPRKHEWVGKPRSEWTKQDYEDNAYYQTHRQPLRFVFGKDTTEEDVDTFLDNILED
jgi:threonine aldolase